MIEVSGVCKRFGGTNGGVVALDSVSFCARKGQVYGLLGPNGAGKTTVLRVLGTLLKPDSGTAMVAGHSIHGNPKAVRNSIGFLSPTTRLYGKLTPLELLIYFAKLHGVTSPKRRADELIESFGIQAFARQRCERLSTGMAQKVSIARAMVHNPPVLILDEPTTGLDVMVAEVFLSFVETARDAGHCVIYSTHIMREVERLCDVVGVLHEGRIRAEGSVEALREQTGKHRLEDVFLAVLA
jgi:sodium transport system ATP-binding protein